MSESESFWEHFHHGADIGVRGVGCTLEESFELTAVALTAVIVDPETVRPIERISLRCQASDSELLLADWLNSLIYEMAVRRMLFRQFEVIIEQDRLRGTALGEPVDPVRHEAAVEVKGATYTELRVGRQENGLWVAQCVVDV